MAFDVSPSGQATFDKKPQPTASGGPPQEEGWGDAVVNLFLAPEKYAANWLKKDFKTYLGGRIGDTKIWQKYLGDITTSTGLRPLNLITRPGKEIGRLVKKGLKNYFWNIVQKAHKVGVSNRWKQFKVENPDWKNIMDGNDAKWIDNFMQGKLDYVEDGFVKAGPMKKDGRSVGKAQVNEIMDRIQVKDLDQAKELGDLINQTFGRSEAIEDFRQAMNLLDDVGSGRIFERRMSGAVAERLPESAIKGARAGQYAKYQRGVRGMINTLKRLGKPLKKAGEWIWKEGLENLVKNAGSWLAKGGNWILTSLTTGGGGVAGAAATPAMLVNGAAVTPGITVTASGMGAVLEGAGTLTTTTGIIPIAEGAAFSLEAGATLEILGVTGTITVEGGALLVAEEVVTGVATGGTKPAIELSVVIGCGCLIIILVVVVVFIFTVVAAFKTSDPGSGPIPEADGYAGYGPSGPPPPGGLFGDGRGCAPATVPLTGSHENFHWDGYRALDVFADEGTPVVAPFAGTAHIYDDSIGGYTVIIHPDDPCYPALYFAHMQGDGRASGEIIEGETIGFVSNSGSACKPENGVCTGAPHIHFAASTSGAFFSSTLDVCAVEMYALWGDITSQYASNPCCNSGFSDRNGCTPP